MKMLSLTSEEVTLKGWILNLDFNKYAKEISLALSTATFFSSFFN